MFENIERYLKGDYKSHLHSIESEGVNFLKEFKDNSIVCISGGKDSLVALDLSILAGITEVVFCDTTLAMPEVYEHLGELEKFYDIEIKVVKPPREFFDLVKEIGYPSRRLRWCWERLYWPWCWWLPDSWPALSGGRAGGPTT